MKRYRTNLYMYIMEGLVTNGKDRRLDEYKTACPWEKSGNFQTCPTEAQTLSIYADWTLHHALRY